MKTNEVLLVAGFAAGAFYLLNSAGGRALLQRQGVPFGAAVPSNVQAVNRVLGTGGGLLPFGGYLPVPFSGAETMMGVNNSIPFWNDFSFVRVK